MKKLLSTLLSLNVFIGTLSTVSCSYIGNEEKETINEITKVIDISSVVSRVSIYSSLNNSDPSKSFTNLSNDIANTQMDNIINSSNKFSDTVSNEYSNVFGTTSITPKINNNINDNSNLQSITGDSQVSNLGSDLPTLLSTLYEMLGLIRFPLDLNFIQLLKSIISDAPFNTQIVPMLNTLLYSKTPSFLDNSYLQKIANYFKPLIPNNTNITNKQALTIAFYNLFHYLNESLPTNLQFASFNKQLTPDYSIPNVSSDQYSNFIFTFASHIKNIDFTNINFDFLPSIFVIINYFFQFFNTQANANINIMNDSQLKSLSVPSTDDAFDYLFSKTKTNQQIIDEINNAPFNPGVPSSAVFNFFHTFSSDELNGETLDRILIILTNNLNLNNDGNQQNTSYNSIMKFLLDFTGGYLAGINSSIAKYWSAIENLIDDSNVLIDLEKNWTINDFITQANSLVNTLPPQFSSVIKTLENNSAFYNKSSQNDDKPSSQYNDGSLSNIWDSGLIAQVFNEISNNFNLKGNNLSEILSNLFSNIHFSLLGTKFKLTDILNILINVINNFTNKNPYDFSSDSAFNILNILSCTEDPQDYKLEQQTFLNSLQNVYSPGSVIGKNYGDPKTFNDLMTSYGSEIKNKSILAYLLMEFEDHSFSQTDWTNLIGIKVNTDGSFSFENNGYAQRILKVINSYSLFLNDGIIGTLIDFVNQLQSLINKNYPYRDVIDPNYWIIKNKKYKLSKSNHYDLPDQISYTLIFNDPDNQKSYSYNISLSKTKESPDEFYGNIIINRIS